MSTTICVTERSRQRWRRSPPPCSREMEPRRFFAAPPAEALSPMAGRRPGDGVARLREVWT